MRKWDIISEKTIVDSPWLLLKSLDCKTGKGAVIEDFFLEKRPDFSLVAAFDVSGNLLIVRQYRIGLDKVMTEMPAGMVEKGEEPLSAAKRELLEETGYEADEWTYLFKLAINGASQTNFAHCFMAQNLKKISDQMLDETEDISISWMPKKEIKENLENGKFTHAFSTAALYRALRIRGEL